MKIVKNVPKLRFFGFDGEWQAKKLGDIFRITAGGDIANENVCKTKMNEFQYPIYANAEKDKGLYGFSNIYKIEENVITVAGRGVNIGIAHARNHKFYPIVRLLVLKPTKFVEIYFFEYQINNLNLLKESTGVPQLTAPQISRYKISFPTLSEQQKIADFLTAVDAKISLLKKKKDALELHKKGVMQQIFSQELRFKADDGCDYPDWEEKKLGCFIDLFSGVALKGDEITEDKMGIPILRGINITEGSIRHSTQIDRYYKGTEVSKMEKYLVEENDLVLGMDGSKVGKNVALIKKDDSKSILIQRVARIRATKKSDIHFIYQNIFSKKFHDYVDVVNTSSGIPHISAQQIKDFKIGFPNLEEQTKIGNFLSAIDVKIQMVGDQVEKMEVWKKGLLQQMFI